MNYLPLFRMDATSSFLMFALSIIPSGVALNSDFNPKSHMHPLDLIIDHCVSQFTAQELTINCSWRGLNTVNNSWFPTGSKVILLFHNSITVIENTTFQGLSQLRVLDLTSNRISSIGSYAFIDLIKLESLYLEDNNLSLFILPATVFCPLVNLLDLRLRYQQFSTQQLCIITKQNRDENSPIYYPSNMFGCLYNLINLTIDTLGGNLYFDKQFNNLTKLTHLGLNCDVDFITNATFANVPHVRYLSFTNALLIRTFDDMAIAPLTKLDYLSFAYVSTGLHSALSVLRPLANKNVTTIKLTEVIKNYYDKSLSMLEGDVVLTKNATRFLISVCVANVVLTRNSIVVIENGALNSSVWNRCLKSLDLRGNSIMGTKQSLLSLLMLKNLVSILIDNRITVIENDFVTNYTSTDIFHYNSSEVELFSHGAIRGRQSNRYSFRLQASMSEYEDVQSITIEVSESLTFIYISIFETFDFSQNIVFKNAFNVQTIDFSSNNAYSFLGNVTGLIGLKKLLLSSNNFTAVSYLFFDNFPSLEELSLSQCMLDVAFMSKYSNRLFQNLSRLISLDLSFNLLTVLSPGTFVSNRNLAFLNLEGNRFTSIPFDLRRSPMLIYLNIRANNLAYLDKKSTDLLDESVKRNGQFSLLLYKNILSCSCATFPFLKWIHETRVTLDNNGNYTCLDNNFELFCTKCIVDLGDLWRQCTGETFLKASIIIFFLTSATIVLVYIRSRMQRFFISMLYGLVYGFRLNTITDYVHGVSIVVSESVANEDRMFIDQTLTPYLSKDLGLSTFNLNNDSNVGEAILSSMEAITSSWRVLIFLGKGFENDALLQFIVSSAIAAQTPANPGQLILLMHEPHCHDLPEAWVNDAIPEDNVIMLSQLKLNYKLRQTLRTRLCQ
ncbi:hypothetical protein Btru_043589 [Bulinus truncatus]|nr:hypothetical protein Btru_043589 [Bulinus truncatus]